MYRKHFGLRREPFSIAPDPRYLYLSERHREAFAHLLYGIKAHAGFVLLTGEVGAGKTTVLRRLLQRLPKRFEFAYVINPKISSSELLATICDEFGIDYPKDTSSIKILTDCINRYLLDSFAKKRRSILIIDEAQNLTDDVLEQIRLLTNLETNERKLLQIILIGQPELRERLAGSNLRQLSQRIVARYHLGPLSKSEVPAYVKHRLTVAGARKDLFAPGCFERLYRFSGGVPRLINTISDRALLGTYARGGHIVDASMIEDAAVEVLGEGVPWNRSRRGKMAFLATGMVALVAILAFVLLYWVKPVSVFWNRGPESVKPEKAAVEVPALDPPGNNAQNPQSK